MTHPMTADLQALEALGKCIDVADGYARQERALPMVPATMEYQLGHIRDAYAKVHEVLTRSPAEGEGAHAYTVGTCIHSQGIAYALSNADPIRVREIDGIETLGAGWFIVREDEYYEMRQALIRAEKTIAGFPAEGEGVVVPRKAWDLWVAECHNPQFFTASSGGGQPCKLTFTYTGEDALKNMQNMHEAINAIALAALTPAPQAEAEIGERPAAPATGDGLVARLKHLAHELDSQWITGSGRDLTLAADHIAALEKAKHELVSLFCSEELSIGNEGDLAGWSTEHTAVVLIRRLRDELSSTQKALEECSGALGEAIKLQSHYATLLNQYDGGERIAFESADAFLDRLRALAARQA